MGGFASNLATGSRQVSSRGCNQLCKLLFQPGWRFCFCGGWFFGIPIIGMR